MRVIAYILLALIVLVIAFLMYYLLVGAILFKIGFARRSFVEKNLKKNIEKKLKAYNVDLCWWEKQKKIRYEIKSFDGFKLVGQFIEANSNRTVIVVHGFGGSHWQMQQYCKLFHDKNFNVLAIDNRAHGESEGNCVGFGFLEKNDVIAWVDFLTEKMPENKILLFGLSMGGTTVCCASGDKNLKNVEAVISDCGFDTANKEICHLLRKHKILLKLFKKHLYSYVKRLYDLDVNQIDATKYVKDTKVPILYIHGQEDNFVPVENLSNLYNSTPSNLRDKFVVEDADHVMAYPVAGVLYEKKISDFLRSRTNLFN